MQSLADGIEPTPVVAAALEPTDGHPTKRGSRWERFVTHIWDPDFVDKSPAERAFVFKLDCYMLASLTLGWWIKNQDQSNLANAYVSGMKEDLKIEGNQYTYMLTIYNAVVCVMCLPANFIVFKLRPSIFLPISEIGWGIFTFAQAGAQSYQQMYVFRFFVAFFEGFYYPLAFFILGSWYTKTELAKRMGLWFVAGPAGSAFSGYLQAAVYNNLDGHAGLAGWRWLYLVCGIMTIPSGILLFFLLPDFPQNTRIWYLSETQKEMARARSLTTGLKPISKTISLRSCRETLRHWRFWVLVPTYAIYGLAVQNATQFGIYLKSEHYSVTDRNVYPSGTYLLQILALLVYTYLSDHFGNRFWPTLLPVIWGLVPTGILAVWPKSVKLKVFAFMVNSTFYITPVFIAWASEICKGSLEERALVIGAMPALFYCFNAWLPNIIFKQTDGPSFRKGFPANFAFTAACAILFVVVRILHDRQLKQEALAESTANAESAHEEVGREKRDGEGDDVEAK